MKIYFVVGVDVKNLAMYTDLFYDQGDALNFAWKLAVKLTLEHPEEFISNPQSTDIEGVTSWVFAEGNSAYVVVEERLLEDTTKNSLGVSDQLSELSNQFEPGNFDKLNEFLNLVNSFNQTPTVQLGADIPPTLKLSDGYIHESHLPIWYVPPSGHPVVDTVPAKFYDPLDDSMPATFSYDNKPMTIKSVKLDINNAQSPNDLPINKRFALAIARIRRLPDYVFDVNESKFNQEEALEHLKVKTGIGYMICSSESNLVEDFMFSLKGDESSSSSEFSEEDSDY